MNRLTRNAVSLAFQDAGKGAPPIVLIHDWGLDHTSLLPQFTHFRHRHRVVAVDLPGHGQSSSLLPVSNPACYAEELTWLCYELGVYRPVAIGHGAGGIIAAELAVRSPDLLAGLVALDARVVPLPWPGTGTPSAAPLAPEATAAILSGNGNGTAVEWDAAALTPASIPVLYVVASGSSADADRVRDQFPRLVVASVSPGELGRREASKQVNALIDAFLMAHVRR